MDTDAVRLRVLIADDNPGVVKAVSRLLSVDHDVVGSVADGRELLEAARLLRPDVVVLDLSLGEVDSLEACRHLTRDHPGLRVIVFTAEDDPEVRRSSLKSGAYAFVSKLSGDGLLSAVRGAASG